MKYVSFVLLAFSLARSFEYLKASDLARDEISLFLVEETEVVRFFPQKLTGSFRTMKLPV